jgi:hypothetical protein
VAASRFAFEEEGKIENRKSKRDTALERHFVFGSWMRSCRLRAGAERGRCTWRLRAAG